MDHPEKKGKLIFKYENPDYKNDPYLNLPSKRIYNIYESKE